MRKEYIPHWNWWLRTGERICLGLDLRGTLAGAEGPKRDQEGFARILAGLRQGSGIVQALRLSGMRLPVEAWSLLEAGEQTGGMGEAWLAVGALLRQREQHQRELTGQLWYPGLVILMGVGVMGILLLWFIPQLKMIAEGLGNGAALPWITRYAGPLYGGLMGAFLLSLVLTGILSIVIRKAGRTSMLCASLAELFKSRLPIVGRIHQVGREGRFLRQLGTLLRGGVALPSALQNMAGSCPSAWERAELEQFRQRLLMGAPVAEGLANCRLLKPATCMLLVAGQEAGRLDQYLIRLAEEDEALAAWRLQQAVRLLEPALLLGLSAAVGGLVLAYLLPMVRLLEQLA